MIQDPSTGKPRGFGFCEYEDSETAMSACRNLAGRELNGRPLRIDSAMNAPGESLKSNISVTVPSGPVEPSIHGAPIPPENAPEAITKAVASLPPEQMFELMKQMKWCIQYNPNETRQLLLHNPQLAYALLQAQVVMKIVDLETAQKLLHRVPRGQPLSSDSHPPPPPPPPSKEPLRQGGDRGKSGWFRDRGGPPNVPHRPGGGRGTGWHNEHSSKGPHPPPPPPHDPRTQPHRMSPRGGPDFHHGSPSLSDGPPDQERALIMQVLNLSDEQIQLLPADKRSDILRLKEQFTKNR